MTDTAMIHRPITIAVPCRASVHDTRTDTEIAADPASLRVGTACYSQVHPDQAGNADELTCAECIAVPAEIIHAGDPMLNWPQARYLTRELFDGNAIDTDTEVCNELSQALLGAHGFTGRAHPGAADISETGEAALAAFAQFHGTRRPALTT